jgi:hypothetical protein
MTKRQIITLAGCVLILGIGGARASEEVNLWPVSVRWDRATQEPGEEWQAVGPLLFRSTGPMKSSYTGLRPLYLHHTDERGTYEETSVLYPLFSYRRDQQVSHWTVFNLINHTRPLNSDSPGAQAHTFDIWPVYFSRDTGTPETSYHALFPIAGTILSRFGNDRLQWLVWPLFMQTEKAGVVTTSTPWPFIKRSTGNGHEGFAIWPLFGRAEKPGEYRQQFYLWPLIYKYESRLSAPVPSVQLGFLPFYTREQRAGAISENFVWPFFGYTKQETPVVYNEKRYFWPLLVQGRGEQRYVNRWAPLYTHSNRKGIDKKWYLWPLLRTEQWTADGLVQNKDQFVWFFYWSLHQRSVTNPQLDAAYKTHLWPLLSVWDNGAGRRQAQFPSPLAVFFPTNEKIRQLYTPLFALYRYDQKAPDDVRHALLWNAISWHRTPEKREFHLGPVFSTERDSSSARIAIGNGLIGMRRNGANQKWRLFLFDFSRGDRKVKPSTAK